MSRGILRSRLFPAICLAAFVAALAAAPTKAGRTVTLAEAENVQGAVSCGGPATTTSSWCSIVCTWACFSTGCAACGCPTVADPGGTGWAQYTTPCGTAGCGGYYTWIGPCVGS